MLRNPIARIGIGGFILLAISIGGEAKGQAVALQNATATFSQSSFGDFAAFRMIDGLTDSNTLGWALFNGVSPILGQTAVFETQTDLNAPQVQIDMLHRWTQGVGMNDKTLAGRFRWSVTADDRSTFADGMQTGGDVTANWTVLVPFLVDLPAGMTADAQPDLSILTGGTIPAIGDYSITYVLPLADVTGFRLEILNDDSLPFDGVGHNTLAGSVVVSEVILTAVPEPASAVVLTTAGLLLIRRRPIH